MKRGNFQNLDSFMEVSTQTSSVKANKITLFFTKIDISIENILVPINISNLTGRRTYEDRRGTIIDWNLCFTADGTSSRRNYKSGTPPFMASIFRGDEPIPRRTLGQDMESFFAVIIWIASFTFYDETAFRNKPIAKALLDRTNSAQNIRDAKGFWFSTAGHFKKNITATLNLGIQKTKSFAGAYCIYARYSMDPQITQMAQIPTQKKKT